MNSPSEVRQVLVAWNGSPAAASALSVAGKLASQLGAGVELLHVWREAGGKEP